MTSTDHPRLLLRRVLAVFIAAALGPLVAGLIVFVFALATVFFGLGHRPETLGAALALAGQLFGMVLLAAYAAGGIVALFAGLLIALWMNWKPPRLSVVLAAVAVAIFAKFAMTDPGAIRSALWMAPRGQLSMALALGLIAATICWFPMRRFVRSQ